MRFPGVGRRGRLAVKKILIGQVWKKNGTDETFLVTKLYNEVFSTYAVLRKIGGEDILRIKVEQAGDNAKLPGFTNAQDADDF
jgi:hypothetical protein